MEPPATPRKPRRTTDADAPEDESKPAKPKATTNRASTTKPAPKPAASKAAAPKPTAGAGSSAAAKPPTSPTQDPSSPIVRPAPKPTSPVSGTATVPPSKPVITDDEPDLFKPIGTSSSFPSPSMAPAKPKGTVDPLSQRPSNISRAEGARIVAVMRTFLLRNGQVWRKTLSNASTTARTSASRLSKPVSSLRDSAGKVTRSSGASINSGLDRWQKSIETSDTAVVVTTLAFIAILIILTVLIVLLIRR